VRRRNALPLFRPTLAARRLCDAGRRHRKDHRHLSRRASADARPAGHAETNALSARRRTLLRRATLARAALLYAERFGLSDGRIPATFEVLFLAGWAPETGW
jgi:hypothetical protein